MTDPTDQARRIGSQCRRFWQGQFPASNTADDGYPGAAPVESFGSNGFGLYEVAGTPRHQNEPKRTGGRH